MRTTLRRMGTILDEIRWSFLVQNFLTSFSWGQWFIVNIISSRNLYSICRHNSIPFSFWNCFEFKFVLCARARNPKFYERSLVRPRLCSSDHHREAKMQRTFTLATAIAEWNCQHLPSCSPGFQSRAHHVLFFYLYNDKLYICHFNRNVKGTNINKKRMGVTH